MKEEIGKALAELITTFLNVKDFVIEQAPDVVQQLLLFQTIHMVLVVTFAIAIIIGPWVWIKYSAYFASCKEDDGQIVLMVMGGFMNLVGTITLWNYLSDLLKVTLAPKLFLLEYASKLL